MKKFIKVIALVVCAVMLCCVLAGCGDSGKTVADVQKAGTLVMATSPDFPPFEFIEGGNVVGIEVEILDMVAKSLGVTLTIEQMDFESVIPGIQAGKFDVGVSGITVTEDRKANVDFSTPYFLASQAIVLTPESTITCKADLEGKKISVQTGTTAEEYCGQNNYEVFAFNNNSDAATALTSGKVDAWVVDNEVAIAMAADRGLIVLDEPMTSEPYAFAFPKGSTELVAAFDAEIQKLLADGTIAGLFEKYEAVFVAP